MSGNTELIEKILARESGEYDNKHINNLSDKRPPRELLDRIEQGITLEELEKIEYPVCRYRTQITIHGLFPEKTGNGYVLDYKHLFQNLNQSIGVRYGAIDAAKKKTLRAVCRTAKTKWDIEYNSSYFGFVQRVTVVSLDDAKEKGSVFKSFFDTVPRNLFYGGYHMALLKCVLSGRVYLEVSIPVNAIREENVDTFCKTFFEMSVDEYMAIRAAELKKRAEEQEQRENALKNAIQKGEELAAQYAAEHAAQAIQEPPKEGLFYRVYVSQYDGRAIRSLARAVILKNGKTVYHRVKNAAETVNTKSKKTLIDPEVFQGAKLFTTTTTEG